MFSPAFPSPVSEARLEEAESDRIAEKGAVHLYAAAGHIWIPQKKSPGGAAHSRESYLVLQSGGVSGTFLGNRACTIFCALLT